MVIVFYLYAFFFASTPLTKLCGVQFAHIFFTTPRTTLSVHRTTFHVQNDHGSLDFHGLAKIICSYAYKYHEQAQKAYDRKLRQIRFETSIAVVSNSRRLDKRSLLFAYYIYVDLKGRKAYHRQARYMKVLERKDRGDCSVITCRIPRWRRSEFERQMRVLKNRAIAERRMDYPEVCEQVVQQR